MSTEINIRQQTDLYLQELLIAQFNVSQNITHRLTKGELREDFIKSLVKNEFPWLNLSKGMIATNNWQSTQIDFICLKDTARVGNLNISDLCDCKIIMEIKSNGKKQELKSLENVSRIIKSKCSTEQGLKSGMFCYSTQASRKTILQDFGFKYDKEIDAFSEYINTLDLYPNVDFFFCLESKSENQNDAYFIVRDYFGKNTIFVQNPVIGYFFNMFKE